MYGSGDLARIDLTRSRDTEGTSTVSWYKAGPRSPLVELEGKDLSHKRVSVECGGLKKTKLESLGLHIRLFIHCWGHFEAPLELEP